MIKNEAIQKINETMFPAAKNGDDVLFEGYWFLMTNDKWAIDDSKAHPAEEVADE
jgi:hypothetical protein